MFNDSSRYAKLRLKLYTRADGSTQSYVARRLLPKLETLIAAGVDTVGTSDRLDHMAHRAYGDGQQFWRLADATLDAEPEELTRRTGRRLRVPMITPE